MKFGGTSVEHADAIRTVCDIVAKHSHRTPLVVVSACAGVTNALLKIAHTAAAGNSRQAVTDIENLRRRHTGIAAALLTHHMASVTRAIDQQCSTLLQLAESVAIIQEITPRLLDQFAACGERWSSLLLASALQERKLPAELCDASEIVITGDEFTRAEPLFEIISIRTDERLRPALREGKIIVTQGFIGATRAGVTTTLGRGGSDFSAAILGSALDAEEIQIWTDVDGFLSADPAIVPAARLIEVMTFNEAAELAYFGAKVLHPSTILPAMRKNIPVRVMNSKRPDIEGTLIRMQTRVTTGPVVKSIACKKGITVITIQSTRMLMAYGFLARVFDVFKQHRKSIDVVATSEVGVSLTIDDDRDLELIEAQLSEFADVSVERNRAVMSVVGENLKYTIGIAGRIFDALARAGVNVEMISHGGSEINLTFVVAEQQVPLAVRSLHAEFFH
jgi:aspartate kinase